MKPHHPCNLIPFIDHTISNNHPRPQYRKIPLPLFPISQLAPLAPKSKPTTPRHISQNLSTTIPHSPHPPSSPSLSCRYPTQPNPTPSNLFTPRLIWTIKSTFCRGAECHIPYPMLRNGIYVSAQTNPCSKPLAWKESRTAFEKQ